MLLWFCVGVNVGAFICILVLADFKLQRFLELGKEFVDKIERR